MNPKQSLSSFFHPIIRENAGEEDFAWYASAAEKVGRDDKPRDLYMAFSAVPRYTGKAPLQFSEEQAQWAYENWEVKLDHFTRDQFTRISLILELPDLSPGDFQRRIQTLLDTADMGEQTAIYKGLPFFSFAEQWKAMAAEGIRTNMVNVFDAIALDNPYPASHLSDNAWNQMVLKAAFIQRPIIRIRGLEKRANTELDRIVSDYAHERWAAGRSITPEIWRAVTSRFSAQPGFQRDIRHLVEGSDLDRKAAALVLSRADPKPQDFPEELQAEREAIRSGQLNWESLSQEWFRATAV